MSALDQLSASPGQGSHNRPRLLDLFCGQGGAAMGYHQAGFEVVGVDIAPQPHYPFEFVEHDAIDFLDRWDAWRHTVRGFDAIHASPPCQKFSRTHAMRRAWSYPDLLSQTRRLLRSFPVPWVIENVPLSPGPWDVLLCGTMFGLRGIAGTVHRHRYFASSIPLNLPPATCNHTDKAMNVYTSGANRVGTERQFMDAMGVTWGSTEGGLESIPPAYTEWIGRQLVAYIAQRSEAAGGGLVP